MVGARMVMEGHGLSVSRRRFVQGASVAGLGFMAGCQWLSRQVQAPAKIVRIGFLTGGAPGSSTASIEEFRLGLGEYGWVEGQNIAIEWRFAEQYDRVSALAAELIGIPVDLAVAQTTLSARALKDVTSTIPIVVMSAPDPVGPGLVESLAYPGGMRTRIRPRRPHNAAGAAIIRPILGRLTGAGHRDAAPSLATRGGGLRGRATR
jgi:hypothetical protein